MSRAAKPRRGRVGDSKKMAAKRCVFISGAGPAGLAAALLFEQLGWEEIVLVEKRGSPEDFEKNKSFNYLLEPRGQRLLERLGILDRLEFYGVDTRNFVARTIRPDGRGRTKKFGIVPEDRPKCYWTTRSALLTMLHAAILDRNSPRVNLYYGHELETVEGGADQAVTVKIRNSQGNLLSFHPDLILACDGLNSSVRNAVASLEQVPEKHFEMIAGHSISTGLRYKVLNLPPRFSVRNGEAADDHQMTYIIPSRHKGRKRACAFYAFPVADPERPRSVNLIREGDHLLWSLKTPEALYEFLEDSFPQLDLRNLVPPDEALDFVKLEAGAFPAPQYARHLRACIGPDERQVEVLLAGDAAHAFPPDLGLGVNAALQDLTVLAKKLEKHGTLAEAAQGYAAEREPESRDLAWLVQVSFPEQYNHRPWRLRVWAAGFILRKGLHRIAPRIFDQPAYFLSQDPHMKFGEMRKRIERTNRRLRALGAIVLAAAVGWGVLADLMAR